MSDMSNCKNCGHPEVAHSKGELKCWIGHHCSCAGFEAGYADTKQAPLTTETPSPTTLEAESREFVITRGDGTPGEMELYASIAAAFATERVQAERERCANQLEQYLIYYGGENRIAAIQQYIAELRGTND